MATDDYMMTPEELRLRGRKRRTILIVALALVLLIVGVIFGARPARDAIKGWQARRHANNAFAFIEHEKWQDARDEAVAAYQLRPNEPQALRAVARFLTRTRQAEALDFWKQLQDRQSLTREDRRDQAAIALAADNPAVAETAVNDLLARKDPPSSPADWLLAAQVALQKSADDDALNLTQKILDAPDADERTQLQAALIAIAIASRENLSGKSVDAAWARLKKLAQGKSKTSLDALVLLAQHAMSDATRSYPLPDKGSQEDKEGRDQPLTNNREQITSELAQRLASHPLATTSHKLLALDLELHLDASKRDTLVEKAIGQWKDGDAGSLLALATWLNGKGEFQKTLEVVPLEKALQSRELLLQHLDALGALDRWEEIRKILQSEKYPLDPVIQRMYLARCNAQLGENTASENNWQRAREAAGNDPGKLLALADYAEKNGALNIAESAYKLAASASPKLRAARQGQLRFAQAQRDTKKIHAILTEMLALWPNDMAIQNDESYTRLLLMPSQQSQVESGKAKVEDAEQTSEAELKAIVDLAENLVKRNPRSLPHRTLLALAYLRQNRAADALAVYENIQVAPAALSPSALAVHAAVLAANAKSDDAKTEANQIPEDKLLPEERELIHELLGQN